MAFRTSRARAGHLSGGRLEDERAVDLEEHPGLQALRADLLVDHQHRALSHDP